MKIKMMENLMSKSLILVGVVFSLVSVAQAGAPTTFPAPKSSEATRLTYPSAVTVEGLGRGLLYSVNFDQVLNDDLAAGAGFGSVGMNIRSGSSANQTAWVIPMYMNYYFQRVAHSFFGTVGTDIVLNYSTVQMLSTAQGGLVLNNTSIIPTFGLGFESRGDNGFLFRVAAYGMVSQNIIPWFGFSFGYAI